MKYIFLLVLTVFFQVNSVAQPVDRSVISSSGDYFENPNVGNLHWTLGEPVIEFIGTDNRLSQGFHQLNLIPQEAVENSIKNFILYPNPNFGDFTLNICAQNQVEVSIEIFNSLGQLVLKMPLGLLAIGENEFRINFPYRTSGTYFLSFLVNGKRLETKEKFQKGELTGKELKFNKYLKIIVH